MLKNVIYFREIFTIRHYLFTFRQHKDNLNTLEVISMDMKRHLKSALKQLGLR